MISSAKVLELVSRLTISWMRRTNIFVSDFLQSTKDLIINFLFHENLVVFSSLMIRLQFLQNNYH